MSAVVLSEVKLFPAPVNLAGPAAFDVPVCWSWDSTHRTSGGAYYLPDTPWTLDNQDDSVLANSQVAEWLQLATGDTHSCGLKSDGTVRCWLFDADSGLSYIDGPAINTYIVAIYAGGYRSCALYQDGEAVCWPAVAGISDTSHSFSQTSMVCTNGDLSCALLTNGSISCVNFTYYPQGDLYTYAQVVCGDTFVCGLLLNGSVNCWGSYVRSPDNENNFIYLAAAPNRLCGISAYISQNNLIWCWGKGFRTLETIYDEAGVEVGRQYVDSSNWGPTDAPTQFVSGLGLSLKIALTEDYLIYNELRSSIGYYFSTEDSAPFAVGSMTFPYYEAADISGGKTHGCGLGTSTAQS